MKFVFYFHSGNLLLISIHGRINEQSLADLTAEVLKLFESRIPDAIIVDLSGGTEFDVTADVVRSFAFKPSLVPKEIPYVVVAPQDHIFGVTRMFQSYADGNRPNVYVVRSLEEAYKYVRSERHRAGCPTL